MNTFEGNLRWHRLAALAAGTVTSLALLSAVLLLFAGVEPRVTPLELAVQCSGAAVGDCAAGSAEQTKRNPQTVMPAMRLAPTGPVHLGREPATRIGGDPARIARGASPGESKISLIRGVAGATDREPESLSPVLAPHARASPVVVAGARQSSSDGCALRLDRRCPGSLLGDARGTPGP
jgi:hypothetical protein